MNYQDLYQDTISKLKRDERPKILLTPELIAELKGEWQKALSAPTIDEQALLQILCILDNTHNLSREFHECFFVTLGKVQEGDLLIYTLGASQKHVVSEALLSGVMIPSVYFDHLKTFLKSKNPEVLEWTLRTIECMGPMSLRFKKEVQSLRPSLLKIFNQHQKASFQIVEFLEKEWQRTKL